MNTHNFVVRIPDINLDVDLLVESTQYPSEQLQEVVLHTQGEEVRYPTIPSNQHTWSVKVPESDSGVVRNTLEQLKTSMYNQKTGLFTPSLWKNVHVFARDLADQPRWHVILHGVWMKGHDQVDLNNDQPTQAWKWQYQFIYQWLEEASDNTEDWSNPMSGSTDNSGNEISNSWEKQDNLNLKNGTFGNGRE